MHSLKRDLMTGKNRKKERSRQGSTDHEMPAQFCGLDVFYNIIIDDKAEDDQKKLHPCSSSMIFVV